MLRTFPVYLLPSVIIGVVGLFVLVPIKTFFISPEEFGIWTIITAFTSPLGPLTNTGTTWILGGNNKTDKANKRELLFNACFLDLTLRASLGLIFMILIPEIMSKISDNYTQNWNDFILMSIGAQIFLSLQPTIQYHLVLNQRAPSHATLEIAPFLANAILTVAFLTIWNKGITALFLGQLSGGIAASLTGIYMIRNDITPKLSKRNLYECIKHGLPSMPSNFIESLQNTISRSFIEKNLGIAALGIFGHGIQYRSLMTQGAKAFSKSLTPEFLKIEPTKKEDNSRHLTLTLWISFLCILNGLTIVISKWLIDLLTHGRYAGAENLLIVWSTLPIVFAFGLPAMQYTIASKQAFNFAKLSITLNILFIPLAWLATKHGDIVITTLGFVSLNLSVQIIARLKARATGYKPHSLEKTNTLIVALSIITTILTTTLSNTTNNTLPGSILILTGVALLISKARQRPNLSQ